MIDNINELAAEAHENAVAHGFYDVSDAEERNIAMLHCELSEAIQEERSTGHMFGYSCPMGERQRFCEYLNTNCYYKDHKRCKGLHIRGKAPEGMAVELADFVIRLLDYAAGHGMKIPTRQQLVPTYASLPRLVNRLHSSINEMVHFREIAADFGLKDDAGKVSQATIIANAIELVETYLDEQGVDLWGVVREKMDYNKTRPMLHGKKY